MFYSIIRSNQTRYAGRLLQQYNHIISPVSHFRYLSNQTLNDERLNPKQKLLEASLSHVGTHGWTNDAIAFGAIDLKLSPAAHGILRNGPIEMVYYWMDKGNDSLKQFLKDNASANEENKLSGEQLVLAALKHRLEYSIPVLRSWPQAMAMGLHPSNTEDTVSRLSEIAELISSYAGENSNTSQWFVQRTTVGGIYAAAELYMLTDYSEDFEDTWQFLENRVVESSTMATQSTQAFGMLNAVAGGLQSIVTGAASVVGTTNVPLPNPEKIGRAVQHGVDAVRGVQNFTKPVVKEEVSQVSVDQPIENQNVSDEVDTIALPNGLSLFGLLSLDVKEAVKLVTDSNPNFDVIPWPVEQAYEESFKPNVVRLLHDSKNIVVDVSRS